MGHTEEELVLVDDIRNAEVDSSKDENERLDDTVKQCDDEDENGLWVDDPVIDHGRGIELGKVCTL